MKYCDFEKVMDARFKIEYSKDSDKNYINNRDYLLDSVMLTIDNTRRIYDAMFKTKRKVHSVVWDGVCELCKDCVRTTDELPESMEYWKLCPSSYQIKKYFTDNFEGLQTLSPLVEEYERQRKCWPNC